MILAAGFFVSGSLFLINLLDPYSLFGRILIHIARPVIIFFSNSAGSILEHFDLYLITPQKYGYYPLVIYFTVAGFFLLVFLVSFFKGRFYCNTFCPVGVFLGLISGFSYFRFEIDVENCNNCGICEKKCKAGCIDGKAGKVHNDRCVGCFDCLAVCPVSAMEYRRTFVTAKSHDPLKRRFLIKSSVAGSSVILSGLAVRSVSDLIIPGSDNVDILFDPPLPATPPGSMGFSNFTQTCTACHLCVKVCYSSVLQPAFLEYGLSGIMQPVMNFRKGKCSYDCNNCTQVCPSGAILPKSLEEKQRIQIGQVEFFQDKCIVYTKKQDCGACAEVCPTHAVYTIKENNIHYPKFKFDSCVGCGACELVCPVLPKAIIVNGNPIHKKADGPFFPEDPEFKGPGFTPDEEFPF